MVHATAPTIFLLGIAGSGMRGLAYLLSQQGKRIIGTDTQFIGGAGENAVADYECFAENEAAVKLSEAQALIYSDAVSPQHPLLQQAVHAEIPTLSYPQAIGEIAATYRTIAITGTHGKSSTTAFLSHILIAHSLDPTALIGASVAGWPGSNARVGHGPYFVVEADEYREHFLTLRPQHAILTTIDFDHPDYFHSQTDVITSYQKFLDQVDSGGYIVTSEATYQTAPGLHWPDRTTRVDTERFTAALPLPGRHMQHNAALACALAAKLGIPAEAATGYLASFPGLGRRFEQIGSFKGMTVISDYGHHPTEITATLRAAREKFPDRRLLVVLEPHTDARLQAFFTAFVDALLLPQLDGVIVCPTFYVKGREAVPKDSSNALFEAVKARTTKPLWHVGSFNDLKEQLGSVANQFDIVIAFSAGVLDAKLRELI